MPKIPCRNSIRLPIFVPNIFLEELCLWEETPVRTDFRSFCPQELPKGKFLEKITKMFVKPLAQTMKIYYNNNKEEEIIKTERENYNDERTKIPRH